MPTFELYQGDCIEAMRTMPDASIDAIVTDPPYGLGKEPDMAEVLRHWLAGDSYIASGGGFMGKSWDSFVPGPEAWRECLRVLKPGGHLLAFFGSRTYDLGTLAIRLAGFEIRDQIMWLCASGFPKSLDVSKAIDKAAGAKRAAVGSKFGLPGYRVGPTRKNTMYGGGIANGDGACVITAPAPDAVRQWQGWGTALKPAHEPIVVARKPLIGTVAENVLEHGTGALNIDACRVPTDEVITNHARSSDAAASKGIYGDSKGQETHQTDGQALGRWPANVIHDGSPEVLDTFAQFGEKTSGKPSGIKDGEQGNAFGHFNGGIPVTGFGDTGSAARFFYAAKASRADRNEGCESISPATVSDGRAKTADNAYQRGKTVRNNFHPTVKPTELMAYLCRLVTPPGGTVLDPFMGSGSTGKACMREGFAFIGIDQSAEYVDIARARISHAAAKRDAELTAAAPEASGQMPLFEVMA